MAKKQNAKAGFAGAQCSANESEETQARPFCCRCKEDFPVGVHERWMMGEMRPLSRAPRKIQNQFRDFLDSEIHGKGYLCGNCYFDLTD